MSQYEEPRGRVIDRAISVLMLLTAVSLTYSVMSRKQGSGSIPIQPEMEAFYLDNWRDRVGAASIEGDSVNRMVLLEFGDYECPYCKRFQSETLPGLLAEFPEEIAFGFIHYPLESIHRFAVPAAAAAECAEEQDRFWDMHRVLFNRQASLGVIEWVALAGEAGVPDTVRFESCIAERPRPPEIEDGIALAESLGITATPTFILDGWVFPRGLPGPVMSDTIRSFLERRASNR